MATLVYYPDGFSGDGTPTPSPAGPTSVVQGNKVYFSIQYRTQDANTSSTSTCSIWIDGELYTMHGTKVMYLGYDGTYWRMAEEIPIEVTTDWSVGEHNWDVSISWDGVENSYGPHTFDVTEGGGATPNKANCLQPVNNGTEIDFSDFVLIWSNGGGADSYNVYIGDTGDLSLVANEQSHAMYTSSLAEIEYIINSSPINQKIYWRIDPVNENGTTTGDEWNFDPRPGKASEPSPTHEAVDENTGLTFTWTAGANANTETFNGGESGSEVELSTGLEVQTFSEWDMDWEVEYGWRIDSVNDFGTTEGDTWTFTTLTYDPPICTWENLPGKSLGPTDGGTEGVDYHWLGTNNMNTVKRLVVVADDALWYETR